MAQPLIAVREVETSSRWYCHLLDGKSGHGGSRYERIVCDGSLVLQLHLWNGRDRPDLNDPDAAEHGNGVLLWFETNNFDLAARRAYELQAPIIKEPSFNPGAHHCEIWLRDPDGYVVVISGPYESKRSRSANLPFVEVD